MGRSDGQRNGARIAVVMSGGGARGAYEAGVLSYLYGELSERLGRPVQFDIVTGTSVGAIHACYVAATQQEPDMGERLVEIWRSLSLDTVFSVGATDLVRVPWRSARPGIGAQAAAGSGGRALPSGCPALFDTEWLESLVLKKVPWPQIRRNIEEGRLQALAIVATEIATGRSVVFIENADGERADLGPRSLHRRAAGAHRPAARPGVGADSAALRRHSHRPHVLLRRRSSPEHAAGAGAAARRRSGAGDRPAPPAHARGGGPHRAPPRGRTSPARPTSPARR